MSREIAADKRADYSCASCGTINSAYNIKCGKCGNIPENTFVSRHQEAVVQYVINGK